MNPLANYKIALAEARVARAATRSPSLRGPVAGMVVTLALAVMVGWWQSPQSHASKHFDEGGLITALSAVFMGMSAGLAGTAFFLSRTRTRPRWPRYFWILSAFGFGFFAIDELLQFHETFGIKMEAKGYPTPAPFRNWNDIVVIGYGVVALVVCGVFLPEILRPPKFAALVITAGGFYVLHTFIDSVSTRTDTSVIFEETAKLFSGGFFALSYFAAIVGIVAESGSTTSGREDVRRQK